jgi:homoserine kinase type II
MGTVYLLWYVREWDEGEDTELFIGVYQTEADAKEAIERLREQPGFVAYPEGFEIHSYEIGKDHWTEGFARMCGDVDITERSN